MNILKFTEHGLQIFAEGGAGSAPGAAGSDGNATQGTGVNGMAAASQTGVKEAAAVPQKGVKNDPFANVKFGKQIHAPAAEAQTQATTEPTTPPAEKPRDLNAEFQSMITGEYKQQADAYVNSIVRQRLKGTQAATEGMDAMRPVLTMMARNYGVDPSDFKALAKAMDADESLWSDAAMRQDLSVPQFKEMNRMQMENDAFRQQEAQRAFQAQIQRTEEGWMQQAQEVQKRYPNFDLQKELQDSRFSDKLKRGESVLDAYHAIHFDELVPAAMQATAKAVERNVVNSVAAGASRPVENGMGGQTTADVRADPSKWSKAELHEVQRRVARGEKVYL